MKRCIICGNVGDDDSTVCEACGNPYLNLEEDDHREERIEPETDVVRAEREAMRQAAGTLEIEEAQDAEKEKYRDLREAEMAEEQPDVQTDRNVRSQPEKRAEAPQGQPEIKAETLDRPSQTKAEAPEEQPERKSEMETGRKERTAHRMKSGPQIYGQGNGQERPGGNEPSGVLRRDINGREGTPVRTAGGQRRPDAVSMQRNAARPMNGPAGGQGRPMSGSAGGQGRPANGPAGGQSRPMNGPAGGQSRPMNGPAGGQGRPMNGPARTMGFQSSRLREASRKALSSPLLLLVALFQTVYFAGSVAAIFMKELNFSQVMRLVTSLPLPTQLTGYTDQMLKLMAKLDTDAVVINLLLHIPELLMCIGLWMTFAAAHTKEDEMSGAGFGFMKAVAIIGLIKNGVLMIAGLVISVALVVSSWVSAAQGMVIAAVLTLIIMIVATMLVIMYYFSYIAMLGTFRANAVEGESYGEASAYVAVIYVLKGLFAVIGLLSGIVNMEISGIIGSAGNVLWMILFAVWIFMYRSKLSEVED